MRALVCQSPAPRVLERWLASGRCLAGVEGGRTRWGRGERCSPTCVWRAASRVAQAGEVIVRLLRGIFGYCGRPGAGMGGDSGLGLTLRCLGFRRRWPGARGPGWCVLGAGWGGMGGVLGVVCGVWVVGFGLWFGFLFLVFFMFFFLFFFLFVVYFFFSVLFYWFFFFCFFCSIFFSFFLLFFYFFSFFFCGVGSARSCRPQSLRLRCWCRRPPVSWPGTRICGIGPPRSAACTPWGTKWRRGCQEAAMSTAVCSKALRWFEAGRRQRYLARRRC